MTHLAYALTLVLACVLSDRNVQDNTCSPNHTPITTHLLFFSTQTQLLLHPTNASNSTDTTNCRPPHAVPSLHASPLFIVAAQQQGCAPPQPRCIPPRAPPTLLDLLYLGAAPAFSPQSTFNSQPSIIATCRKPSQHHLSYCTPCILSQLP
jgi:hypothetical protein